MGTAWPSTIDEVTARQMILGFTEIGLAASAKAAPLMSRWRQIQPLDATTSLDDLDMPPTAAAEAAAHRWYLNCEQMQGAHDRIVLLGTLLELDQEVADQVARQIWLAADAGDSYGEHLYDAAFRYGLDADGIVETATREVAEEPAPTPPAVQWWLRRADGHPIAFDEYSHVATRGPGDWSQALDDADSEIDDALHFGEAHDGVPYEMLRAEITVHARRTITADDYPTSGHEGDD